MGRLRASLVSAPPAGPTEHVVGRRRVRKREARQHVPHLGDGQRNERRRAGAAREVPLSRGAALARTTARKACAKSASVT